MSGVKFFTISAVSLLRKNGFAVSHSRLRHAMVARRTRKTGKSTAISCPSPFELHFKSPVGVCDDSARARPHATWHIPPDAMKETTRTLGFSRVLTFENVVKIAFLNKQFEIYYIVSNDGTRRRTKTFGIPSDFDVVVNATSIGFFPGINSNRIQAVDRA
jgi:hypothetical protein